MPRNFSFNLGTSGERGSRFYLQVGAGVLAVLNLVAVYLLLFPPGGTRNDLRAEGEQLKQQIMTVKAHSQQLHHVSTLVQLGSDQSSRFDAKYILPKRTAYERLITELERMTKVSGMRERDASYTEEPIEGSDDLTLLTSSANYEGTYENLRRFLTELDHSKVLIMLDTLTASPQQKGNEISTSMRFQTLLQEEKPSGAGVGMP